MKETLKLQYSYLLNKISAWFLIIMTLVLTVGILYASGFNSFDGELDMTRSLNLLSYQNETYLLVKFVLIAVTVFLSIQGYYSQFTKYHVFFLQSQKGKVHLGIAKQTSVMIIQVTIMIHAGLFIHIVGYYLTPYFRFEMHYFMALCSIFVEAVIIGLIGSILIQLIDSIFMGIVPMFLFWLSEANAVYDEIIQSESLKILYALIPSAVMDINRYVMIYDWFHYALIVLFLWLFNLFIFVYKDMK